MVGVLSRSVGNTTASHNRFGAYLRGRVIPTNPNTTNQVAQRTSLHDRSQEWRALTDTQRAGWAALGSTIVRQDSLGNNYTLTGLQAYTSYNRRLVYVGAAVISDAPALAVVTPVATATLTANA